MFAERPICVFFSGFSKLAASMSLFPSAVISLIPQAFISLQKRLSVAVLCPHAMPSPLSQVMTVGTLKEFAGIMQCDHGWRDHAECQHPPGAQLVPPAGYISAVCQCTLDRVLQLVWSLGAGGRPKGAAQPGCCG